MSRLPDDVAARLGSALAGAVQGVQRVGGGCIANACRVETDAGLYFLKWSRDPDVARTFPAEAAGLRALRAADTALFVPEARAAAPADADGPGVLLMDWIDQGPRGDGFWDDFGAAFAALHRHTAPRYGFATDNYIGRLPQANAWMDAWPAFVRARRLGPQVRRAREEGVWDAAWDRPYERLEARLEELLPADPPASVLHGDLWSGNFLVTAAGGAALIDPAAYYGHREADLAMTELFGGFDARFYDAYRAAWPLEPGYETRRDVYALYHLINHLNHFGGGYAGSVGRLLDRLGG